MIIDSLYEKKHTMRFIARKLSRVPSTISREIRANRVNSQCYDAQEVDTYAHKRRTQTRKKHKIDNPIVKKLVVSCLKKYLSPHGMVGKSRLEKIFFPYLYHQFMR